MERIIELWNSAGPFKQTAIAVAAALGVYIFARSVVLRKMERLAKNTTNDLDDRLVHFIKQFLWLIGLFVTVLLVLRINQIAITPLLAGAGIAGIAVGLAAKELLADILSGVFLIMDRPEQGLSADRDRSKKRTSRRTQNDLQYSPKDFRGHSRGRWLDRHGGLDAQEPNGFGLGAGRDRSNGKRSPSGAS